MKKEDHKPIGRTVVPESYEETMQYLEGQRRLAIGDEVRRLYQTKALTEAKDEDSA